MLKKHTKTEIYRMINNLLLVIAGSAVLAFGTAVFIIPYDLVNGGLAGLAIVLEKVIPVKLGVDAYVTFFTWLLFFVGLFFLGKDFAMKTFVSSIFYPVMLTVFMRVADTGFMGGFFDLKGSSYPDLALLLAAIFGGILSGIGCAITFIGGGSTGGVDILAFLICKVFRRLRSSHVMFAIDAIIIILGMFVINDLVLTLLGIISAFVFSYVVDHIFLGSSKAYVAHIVSDRYDDISRQVIEKLDRSTTIYDATGGYSRQPKKVVMVSFTVREYSEILNIINQTDKYAFVTVHSAHEINGEGWTREKV